MTLPSDVNRLTSSMAGILVTPSFFSVLPNFLSSDVAVLCIVFFFPANGTLTTGSRLLGATKAPSYHFFTRLNDIHLAMV